MKTKFRKSHVALVLLLTSSYSQVAYPCIANSSQVTLPEGKVLIDRMMMGDRIMSFSPNEQLTEFRSEPESVKFVSGTPADGNRILFMLQTTTNQSLLATNDQVLVTVEGKLIRASKLQAGDKFWGCNGEKLQLASVVQGRFNVGVVGLSTDYSSDDVTLDNHFICANGIIAGDFYIQLHYDDLVDEEKSDHAYYSEYRR